MNRKRYLLIISLIPVILLAACSPTGSTPSGKETSPHTISASGTGIVYLVPDLAYINIGVQSRSEDVGLSLRENNAQALAISKVLTDMGVEAKDIQTSAFNVYPQPQYGPSGEITKTEYVVDNSVVVTVRDLSKLGEMLDAVVKAGANNINSIQFDVTDKKNPMTEARKAAIDDARAIAQEIADAAGVRLGDILSVSTYSSNVPVPMYEGKGIGGNMAVQDVSVSAGQLILTVNADITYSIQ